MNDHPRDPYNTPPAPERFSPPASEGERPSAPSPAEFVRRAYPGLDAFREIKRRLDPAGVLTSDVPLRPSFGWRGHLERAPSDQLA